jgi:RNA polymerase sigma-70 factor (ECF subfamily)
MQGRSFSTCSLAEPSLEDSQFSARLRDIWPALNKFAGRLCRNKDSADDLTQETLAKAWKARRRFAPGSNLRQWLFTIMHNHFRSEQRRAWRQEPWDALAAERISAPPGEQLWSVELGDAARALNALPPRQRDTLLLAGFGGFSTEETATLLDCRPKAIKNRVCRARQVVRQMLDGKKRINGKREKHETDPLAQLAGQMNLLSRSPS